MKIWELNIKIHYSIKSQAGYNLPGILFFSMIRGTRHRLSVFIVKGYNINES